VISLLFGGKFFEVRFCLLCRLIQLFGMLKNLGVMSDYLIFFH